MIVELNDTYQHSTPQEQLKNQKMSKKFLLFFLCLTVFLTVIFSKVRYTDSDPIASLLVSQAIIKQGTVKLDSYKSIFERYRCVITENEDVYGCVIYKKNNHYYYYFPLGTPVFSVPFVAIINIIGYDVIDYEKRFQIIISAINATLIFALLFFLACLYLDDTKSFLISGVTWFGTSFASTTGTALWSHNFATLFALLAIYLSIRSVKTSNFNLWPVIAISLFSCYLCRPTMMLLSPFLIFYLFLFSKKSAIYIIALISVFLIAFVGFSFYEFGQPLPDYYLPQRLSGEHFVDAIYGNLLSPSRGILVFSPFLLIPLVYFRNVYNSIKNEKSLLILLSWPILHLILISRFPHWWAGWSYGPRLMTDVLPGIFLLIVITASRLNFIKPSTLALVIALSAFSIYINTFQGLFNYYTRLWNAEPNIDEYPEYLFDWRFPQFLHNKSRHEERLIEFNRRKDIEDQQQ